MVDFVLAFVPFGVREVGELELDLIEPALVAFEIPLIKDELFQEFEGGFGVGLIGVFPALIKGVEILLVFVGKDEDVRAAAMFDGVFAGVGLYLQGCMDRRRGGWG